MSDLQHFSFTGNVNQFSASKQFSFKMERDERTTKALFYVSKLIYPKYNPFWFIFYMYLSYFKIIKRKTTYILQSKPYKYILDCLSCEPKHFDDINSTVVVYENNLYRTDRILRLLCLKKQKYRIVRVLPSSTCQKDKIICSETCYYNLNSCGFDVELKLSSFNEGLVKFASEMDVSLISCPYDISNAVIDAVLEKYFKTPKLLSKGDIIEINIKYFARELFYLNNKVNHVESIFFKCNKLLFENSEVEGTYFCVIGETAIKQSANVQSFVPPTSTKSVNRDHCGNFEEVPLCPYGLQSYLESMKKAVTPFLRRSKLLIF